MNSTQAQQLLQHPQWRRVARKKALFGWGFALLLLVAYGLFLLLIGFFPQWLAQPLAGGLETTRGIVLGCLLIVWALLLTGIYVRRANGELEAITRQLTADMRESVR